MLSVGFVGPLPPTRSGIADYDAEILSSLSKNPSLSVSSYEPADAAAALKAKHDVLLVQIGNDPLHAPSVEALFDPERRTPAVVVLHEFVLHHLFAAAYLTRSRPGDYVRELERAHGARGMAFAATLEDGSFLPVWDLDPWRYPMSAGVIRAAEAVVAHSKLVTGAVLAECPGTRAVTIPQHVAPAPRTPTPRGTRGPRLPAGPAGRDHARDRVARQTHREDPRGARDASARAPALLLHRRGRGGRRRPPIHRAWRPASRRT